MQSHEGTEVERQKQTRAPGWFAQLGPVSRFILRLKDIATVTRWPARSLQSQAHKPRPLSTHSPDGGDPGRDTWFRVQKEKEGLGEGKGPWNKGRNMDVRSSMCDAE